MSMIFGLFSKELRKMGFFEEWARSVRTKANASGLAGFTLEAMRDPEKNERRSAFTAFMTFARTRSWPEVLLELESLFPEESLETLKDPYADLFYVSLKTIVLEQVDSYYEAFMSERDRVKKGIREAIEKGPLEELEVKVLAIVHREVSAQMEVLMKNLKKMLGEGDDWKGGVH